MNENLVGVEESTGTQGEQVFCKYFFLENFAGKYLCRSLFLMKFQALRPIALLKIDYNKDERCFSENFVKF